MNLLTSFVIFALVGLLFAAPTSDDHQTVAFAKSIHADNVVVKYNGNHDIVSILIPLNRLNVRKGNYSSFTSKGFGSDIPLFFVEADIKPDGSRVDQGLYILKDGQAKKLLENGRDAAASKDYSKLAFFGAKDGLYVYNQTTDSAEKYGPITDSIIGIAKEKEGDVIYILTEDLVVYKVKDNGETKEKIEDVVGAKQIVLDDSNNIYFYSDDNEPYVRTINGVKKIEGLPKNPGSVKLLKPPFFLENSVPFVVDNSIYIISANGKSKVTKFRFNSLEKPTAYAPEAVLIQYYGYNKKIYGYHLIPQSQRHVSKDHSDSSKAS